MSLLNVGAINESIATPIVSASSINIWSEHAIIPVTGTASISSFTNAPKAGAHRVLLAQGAFTLTTGTNFVVSGGSQTVMPGDLIDVFAETITKFLLIPKTMPASIENFLANSLKNSSLTGWNTYGTNITAFDWSTETNIFAGGGLKATINSTAKVAGDYFEGDFGTIHPSQLGQIWTIKFSYFVDSSSTFGVDDIEVGLYDGTNFIQAGFLNASVENTVSLATFTIYPTTSVSYKLRFKLVNGKTSSGILRIADINVNLQKTLSGFAGRDWSNYTPTVSGFGTSPTVIGLWRQVGRDMEIKVRVLVTNITGAGSFFISMPDSYFIDTSRMTSSAVVTGRAVWTNVSTGLVYVGTAYNVDTGNFNIYGPDVTGPWGATIPSAISTSTAVTIEVSVPIAQWAVNTNMVEQFVEYAYNSSATTADDIVSFGYGPEGVLFQAFNYTVASYNATVKRVQFKTPIKTTDELSIEVLRNSSSRWVDVSEETFIFRAINGDRIYGMDLDTSALDVYSVNVRFGGSGRASQGATFSSNGAPWSDLSSAGARWRIKKKSNSNSAQFPSITIQPLTAVQSSGATTTYTIPFAPGERKIYIPAAYLKTAGTAGTLTITTGVSGGTNLVIPLSASTDTITSGDFLTAIYISYNGSITAENWSISGSNTNGSYKKTGDGTMDQWNLITYSASATAGVQGTVFSYPISFIADPSISGSAVPGTTWTGYTFHGVGSYTSSQGQHQVINTTSAQNFYIGWRATGRWKA